MGPELLHADGRTHRHVEANCQFSQILQSGLNRLMLQISMISLPENSPWIRQAYILVFI